MDITRFAMKLVIIYPSKSTWLLYEFLYLSCVLKCNWLVVPVYFILTTPYLIELVCALYYNRILLYSLGKN